MLCSTLAPVDRSTSITVRPCTDGLGFKTGVAEFEGGFGLYG